MKMSGSGNKMVRGRTRKSTGGTGKLSPHECLFCSKVCKTYYALELHSNLHTGEKPYSCTECDASFSDHRYLWSHRNMTHFRVEYTCKFCGRKEFSEPSAFYKHRKTCSAKATTNIQRISRFLSAKKKSSLGAKNVKERFMGKQDGNSYVDVSKRRLAKIVRVGDNLGQVGVPTTRQWDASFFLHMNRYVPDP